MKTNILLILSLIFLNHSNATNLNTQNIANIINESQKTFNDPKGRPLPLAAGGTGELVDVYPHNRDKGSFFTPHEQIQMLQKGHHLLPTLGMYSYRGQALSKHYYEPFLKKLSAWGLPFTISTTQWEQDLYLDEKYFKSLKKMNPNLLTTEGKLQKNLSPFGATKHWSELGKKWATETKLKEIQALYPNPPAIIWLSNNEAKHLLFHEAEQSQRFVDLYGKKQSSDFKKEIFHKAWQEKYLAFQTAIKNNLQASAWRDKLKFVGYNVDAVNPFGRWPDWTSHNHFVPNKLGISNQYTYWDGGAVEYYLNPWAKKLTDFTVFSPQIEFMNVQMSLNEIRIQKPNYWFEMFVWDGFESEHPNNPIKNKRDFFKSIGQNYSPQRYKGWLQFGMWLTQPRVVREFRGWAESRESVGLEYFEQVLNAVDSVYTNPTLKRFWRQGELIVNHKYQHPYQVNIPKAYKTKQRWFLLDTNLNPKRPWNLETELPVYALARVIKKDNKAEEWLIYAHAPKGLLKNVRIQIPNAQGGYLHEVSADVPTQGIFIHLNHLGQVVTF
ncbi:MAG: Unknown protein [uncultured Sulfurovum sp.]|uniref:Uncharacterized protein n=1 Tax=uncultured Sulfurovum sp. TaxID=269237 RepID=A0A6S6SMT3_9BACT|nr:MAG: Unknown protein [uncultured Sulfurovum sp.]